MQSQWPAGRVAFSAHGAVWRAAGALSGGDRDWPGFSVRAFHCDMYLHGIPFDYLNGLSAAGGRAV